MFLFVFFLKIGERKITSLVGSKDSIGITETKPEKYNKSSFI